MLSEKVQELIKKSRIVSFRSWKNAHPAETVAIFQQADDENRYLTDEELQQIKKMQPHLATSLQQTQLLRDSVTEIINNARAEVMQAYPDITKPGGGLYPPVRAEACWRDFWHFLRCISYGIAGERTDYTNLEGLAYMEQLYQELQVPLDAMILGLENLKIYGLKKFSEAEADNLAPYFDSLIVQMKEFDSYQ